MLLVSKTNARTSAAPPSAVLYPDWAYISCVDHFDPRQLTAAQSRARAEFIRQTAEARHVDDVRQSLMDVAERYEQFATLLEARPINDAAERSASWFSADRDVYLCWACMAVCAIDGGAVITPITKAPRTLSSSRQGS